MRHRPSTRRFLLATATVILEAAQQAVAPLLPRRADLLATGEWNGAGERGETDRRILLEQRVGIYERRYHATKGWRLRRLHTA